MVELVITDTGCGVTPEDREKLFLPYFLTKGRGTGLGLAIVNHILADHDATIRVEDNQPTGARFIVEVRAAVEAEISETTAALRAAFEAVVKDAEVVILATTSTTPVVDPEWIAPGAHVTTIGPISAAGHELPPALAARGPQCAGEIE